MKRRLTFNEGFLFEILLHEARSGHRPPTLQELGGTMAVSSAAVRNTGTSLIVKGLVMRDYGSRSLSPKRDPKDYGTITNGNTMEIEVFQAVQDFVIPERPEW